MKKGSVHPNPFFFTVTAAYEVCSTNTIVPCPHLQHSTQDAPDSQQFLTPHGSIKKISNITYNLIGVSLVCSLSFCSSWIPPSIIKVTPLYKGTSKISWKMHIMRNLCTDFNFFSLHQKKLTFSPIFLQTF